ncbi:MAG: hypothetical protein GY940_45305 [bacterium]|nr:hypothetical protein [bacterium]
METPKITYNHLQLSSGSAGFKPRYTGSPCRLDNISAARIDKFSYNGPPQPAGRDYNPRELITQWDVAGPFAQRMNDIETNGFDPAKTYPHQGKTVKWETIKADGRGCVVTGRRMGKFSSKNFMYLHTEIEAETGKKVDIVFSSTNPGILMVNNKPVANITPSVNAWYDFMENPKHGGASIEISLNPGKNHIVVLFSGGRYAGDGFYARFTEVVE